MPDLCGLIRMWADSREEMAIQNPEDWTVVEMDRRIDEGLAILTESICEFKESPREVDREMDLAIRNLVTKTLRRIGLTWNPCLAKGKK